MVHFKPVEEFSGFFRNVGSYPPYYRVTAQESYKASRQGNSRFLCETKRVILWNALTQAQFRHYCHSTYGLSCRRRALVVWNDAKAFKLCT